MRRVAVDISFRLLPFILLFCLPNLILAQGPPPPPPPPPGACAECIPIDQGEVLLIVGGMIMGYVLLRKTLFSSVLFGAKK